MSCHSVAVVLTLVQTKQIRINIHKRNNTKNTAQTIQNTVNTSTHITKIPTHYKTYTYTHPHITKQVKISTVQDTPKWTSYNIIKYAQYKILLMYMVRGEGKGGGKTPVHTDRNKCGSFVAGSSKKSSFNKSVKQAQKKVLIRWLR